MSMPEGAPRLVCLGNFTVDDVYLPDGSMVPQCMGGDALYAALGARLWEPQVQLLAPIAPDIPENTLEAMRTTGFDLRYLPVRDVPIIRNRIFYDSEGGRRWEILAPEHIFNILSPRPEDIPAHYLQAQAFLVLAMTLDAQEVLINWLHAHTPAILALDTQEDYVTGNEGRILNLASQVNIFMPSAVEAEQLLGHRDWLKAAWEFADLGPQIVVIKCGDEGAVLVNRETREWIWQEPLADKVVDTTGAGDAFCGGFMAAYLQNKKDLRRAAYAGAISASYAIASFGMTELLNTRPEDAQGYLPKLLNN